MGNALIGTGLRPEGRIETLHLQLPLPQELRQDAVLQEHQAVGMQLHRHVAIPQVISRLQQGQGVSAADLHHRLRRRLDLHPPVTVVADQAIPGLQSRATGKLQHEITATATAAMAPQARALISRQG